MLTLPGIAGFVLSIGMAVDANVLIFERLKEEIWHGHTLRAAVRTGFGRAFWTVFDSHFTTIVGAGVLFMLGTGTVKGFAYTLFWGTVLSMVTAVFITRFFTDLVVDNDVVTDPNHTFKHTLGARGVRSVSYAFPSPELERRLLVPHRLDHLVRHHRAGVLMMGYNYFTSKGYPINRSLGLSFTGGTDVTAKFAQPTKADIKPALAGIGVADAQVNTIGKQGERYTISTQKDFGNDTAQIWGALNSVGRSTVRSRRSHPSVRRSRASI